ncbi:hypothetical protein GCM10020331_004680 [Ectobacillus funiculus]
MFANFAEAIAEGRGKAQADTLRKKQNQKRWQKNETKKDGSYKEVPSTSLRKGDIVRVDTGEIIPSDGEIIEGLASIDESAITGESAPVIKEAGGDFSSVTGGTRVVSDYIIVKNPNRSGRIVH